MTLDEAKEFLEGEIWEESDGGDYDGLLIIKNGYLKIPWGRDLSYDEIEALAVYMRSLYEGDSE